MGDDELCFDEEYINVRKTLRGDSLKGLCDEYFSNVGHHQGLEVYEDSNGDVNSSETDEESDMVRRRKNKGCLR